jgi:hypothetical protein
MTVMMTRTKMTVIMMIVMMKGREKEGKDLSIFLPFKENVILPFSVVVIIIIHQSQNQSAQTREMNIIKLQVRRSLGQNSSLSMKEAGTRRSITTACPLTTYFPSYMHGLPPSTHEIPSLLLADSVHSYKSIALTVSAGAKIFDGGEEKKK